MSADSQNLNTSELQSQTLLATALNTTSETVTATPPIQSNHSSARIVYLNLAITEVNEAGHTIMVKQCLLGKQRGFPVDITEIRSIQAMNSILAVYLRQTLDQYGLNLFYISGYAISIYSATKGAYAYNIGPDSTNEAWNKTWNDLALRATASDHCSVMKCKRCTNPPFVFACVDHTAFTNALLSKGFNPSAGLKFLDSEAAVLSAKAARSSNELKLAYSWLKQINTVASLKRAADFEDDDNNDGDRATKKQKDDPEDSSCTDTDSETDEREKRKPWWKATYRPSGTTKAESDTCFTCIRYNRTCKGTTIDDKGKCENCQGQGEDLKSKRKCYWRVNHAYTYRQTRKKSKNPRYLPANTREARALRKQSQDQTPSSIESSTPDASLTMDFTQEINVPGPDVSTAIEDPASTADQDGTQTGLPNNADDSALDNSDLNFLLFSPESSAFVQAKDHIDQDGFNRMLDDWSNRMTATTNTSEQGEHASNTHATIQEVENELGETNGEETSDKM